MLQGPNPMYMKFIPEQVGGSYFSLQASYYSPGLASFSLGGPWLQPPREQDGFYNQTR